MKITIIGTGYVGLVTGAIFADFGNLVTCLDIDEHKISILKEGQTPFFEPGLVDLVKKNIEQKRLFFTSSYKEALDKAEVVFICVGTPSQDNGHADLTYVKAAVEETAKNLTSKTLIVLKSTIPVGAEEVLKKELSPDLEEKIEFASCPEFLREGSAVEDALHPDRVVIGVSNGSAKQILTELYKPFNSRIIICSLASAQLIKYVSNSFLAMKISFANLVAELCDQVEADAEIVLQAASIDKRIGRSFLYPGVGYGGSCFPKDVNAFINIYKSQGLNVKLLEAVKEINHSQISSFVKKAEQLVGNLKGKTLTILGLAFKPNTDDLRQAPSMAIIQELLKKGANLAVYDPVASDNAKKILGNKVKFCSDVYSALENSEALLLITEWNEFKELDLVKVKSLMKSPIILDGRNIFDPEIVKSLGFKYQGIGRS
ncbi:UDP-glucose/GDP-mannose dehydrogenase family protein [Candidatus Daviesbacteria bacterium]|nr:UDP-glucose/GDP-mannose dehydrogenase family protein [Candidatus Daviesbacteria bacterium]